jgi:dipeptidyl aminopeptidase/acylaminoacyl peptidase
MKGKTILALLFLMPIFIKAQTTGSFQQSITFTEPDYNFTRTLYYYVPADYDPDQSYKLVVGFRGGPHNNAGQFRDQLTFLSDSIGAIILCPENEDHFWNEEGLTKQLFKYSLDTTLAMYNIDPDFIYLTGLSYGGRHAVIVSMDTDNGAIPNLRGVIPFAAGSDSHLQPDYGDIADFPPACLCIGLNDNANFQSVSNTLHTDITSNGGASLLNEIPGVGHTVAFSTYPQEMLKCLAFIESQYETTGVGEALLIDEGRITIQPNPATHTFKFSYDASIHPQSIYITDVSGRILMQLGPDQKEVNVSDFLGGIKILVIKTDEEVITKKIVIIE